MLFVLIYVLSLLGCLAIFGYMSYDQLQTQKEITVGDLGIMVIFFLVSVIPYLNVFGLIFGVYTCVDMNQHKVIYTKKGK